MRHLILLSYGLFLIACIEQNQGNKLSKQTQSTLGQAGGSTSEADKTKTSCDEIDEIKPCTERTLGCEWVYPDPKNAKGICQELPPPPPPPQPKFACSQFDDKTDCKNNLLGCDWDPADDTCKESLVISAQSCFHATDEQTCKGHSATGGCRWQFFSALKSSKCVPGYIPNDQRLSHQWHLLNKEWGNENGINAIDAWSITRGNPKVVIGVIDHGFPANYRDFDTSCKNRSITIQEINNPPKSGDHGVWVSSVAAACSNTGVGMSGVDQLSSVTAASLPYNKGFARDDYLNGFRWLRNLPPFASNTKPIADIVNLSLGKREIISSDFGYFIDDSIRANIIIVSAAGNDGKNIVRFKAKYPYPTVDNISCKPGAISVGATNDKGVAGNFSNWGPFVDILAPGVRIPVTNLKDPMYSNYPDGTSFSSPIISGVAALMKSVYPTITPQIARHIMRRTARPMTCEQLCPASRGPNSSICKADMCPASNGNELWRPTGLINAYAAVRMAKEMFELGKPVEPIVQSNFYWVGIGTKKLAPKETNNAEFTLTNYGKANASIRLAANQDPNVSIHLKNTMMAPIAIAAQKSAAVVIKYAGGVSAQKAMPVYLEVLDDAGNFIDSFAILLVVAK